MKRLLSFILLCLAVLSCRENNNKNQQANKSEDKEFVLLFTNDFHSQIEPTSKDATYNADMGGAVRLKALIDSVRTAAVKPAIIFFITAFFI